MLLNIGGEGAPGLLVVAYFAGVGSDFAKLSLIFLHIVGEGEEKLLGVLRAHNHAAYNRRLRHARRCENEVDKEFIGGMTNHSKVCIFTVGKFGTELNLKLVLFIIIFHS